MKKRIRHKLTKRYKSQILRDIFVLSQKDIDNTILTISPLSTDDNLFVESTNPNDPRLMPNAIDNELYYEYGYIGTTIFLLNIIEFGKSYFHKDSYIYPALFCFRQYIENIMKTIILKYDANGIEGLQHDLNKCWEKLLSHIQDSDHTVLSIGNIIHELQEIDCYASAFRYTGLLNNQYGQKSKLQSKQIDVRELKNRILQVYAFFDGLYEMACRKCDAK